MGNDRIEKCKFSLAVCLVLVAAMFSFYLSPSTTGQFYTYPEIAAGTPKMQPISFQNDQERGPPYDCHCTDFDPLPCPPGTLPGNKIPGTDFCQKFGESELICKHLSYCYVDIECVTGGEKLPGVFRAYGKCRNPIKPL